MPTLTKEAVISHSDDTTKDPSVDSVADLALSQQQITALLDAWQQGDTGAENELMRLAYDRLRRIAHHHIRNERNDRIQTTELVHEAYMRLVGLDVDWQGRSHFYGLTAHLMRNILVDQARHDQAIKRGSGNPPRPLLDIDLPMTRSADLLALDDALRDLAGMDRRKAKILEMRYFGGMTHQEISEVLEVSVSTIEREQRLARAWLARELDTGP